MRLILCRNGVARLTDPRDGLAVSLGLGGSVARFGVARLTDPRDGLAVSLGWVGQLRGLGGSAAWCRADGVAKRPPDLLGGDDPAQRALVVHGRQGAEPAHRVVAQDL